MAAAAISAAAVPLIAYQFAVLYRERAGTPARFPVVTSPASVGLPFESVTIPGPAGSLPGWFVPARDGAPGPAIILIHGWSSNRSRMLPNAEFLNAAGFHTLLFDVRGHGDNPPDPLPVTGAEFGEDAAAAAAHALSLPNVTAVGLLGHSMGGVGACLAAASEPRVGALVSVAAPADPRLLVRETFRMARLHIPAPIAHPLAWLTARVYVRPRGHRLAETSARRAVARYSGPVLIIHGDEDEILPLRELDLLERAARTDALPEQPAARVAGAPGVDLERTVREVETLIVPGGRHRWLYESPLYRRTVARFLARTLGGPFDPELAGELAVARTVQRPADTEGPLISTATTTLEAGVESGLDSKAGSGASGPNPPGGPRERGGFDGGSPAGDRPGPRRSRVRGTAARGGGHPRDPQRGAPGR